MTAFALKIFAMILMVGDHLHSFIPNQPVILTLFGRLVAPIFVFFMVEGFFYTRSKFNYAKRLAIGAVTMMAGNQVLNILLNSDRTLQNNIFATLFISFCMIWAIDNGRKAKANSKEVEKLDTEGQVKENIQGKGIVSPALMYILATIFGLLGLFTEGSVFSLAITLVFYFTRNKKSVRNIAYVAVMFMLTIGLNITSVIADPQTLIYDFQWFSIFAIIPIALYNGKRGLNTKFSKNLFYYFYPIHIWILFTIGTFLR